MSERPEQLDLLAAVAEQGFDDWDVFAGTTPGELSERWGRSTAKAIEFLEAFERRGVAERLPGGRWRATAWAARHYRIVGLIGPEDG